MNRANLDIKEMGIAFWVMNRANLGIKEMGITLWALYRKNLDIKEIKEMCDSILGNESCKP